MSELTESSAPVLYAKAKETASQIEAATGVAFDPTILLTIFTAILKALGVCGVPPQKAPGVIKNPSRIAKWILNRECAKHSPRGSEEFDLLVDGVRDLGDRLTSPQIKAMYAEAGVSM